MSARSDHPISRTALTGSASCDAAVACLVLCTVPDQGAALAELARVLKPDGELRFLEHLRSDRPRQARVQQRLDRWGVWPRVGGGCHCSRDTVAAIRAAAFDIDAMHEFQIGPSWMVTSRHVRGRARVAG